MGAASPSRRAGKGLLICAGLLSGFPSCRLEAQNTPISVTWFGKGLQAGLCVEFLVSPESVRQYLRGDVAPAPIESLASRHPALARVAQDEAAYRGWVPAEYCWYLYGEGVVGGRRVVVDDGRLPVAIGYLAIAAMGLPDSADAVVATLFTNAKAFSRAAKAARLMVEDVDLTVGFIPTEEDSPTQRRYVARHGATTVQWDGGPGAARPPESLAIHVSGMTIGRSYHGIQVAISPDSAFVASGNLRVTGQGELQALMAASPIRLVTNFLKGGDGDWVLGR